MSKLLINATTVGNKPTGLGVYSNNCIAIAKEKFDVDCISTERGSRFQAPDGLEIGAGKFSAFRRAVWLNTIPVPVDFLLYSPTHHGCWRAKRQIITIHDLIAIDNPDQHPNQYRYFRYFMPKLIKKCTAVFTVSETTKFRICEYYGYPKERVFVIPNGVDGSFSSTATYPPVLKELSEPYLLVVGANYPHKNIEELLNVSALWRERFCLVIASCTGSERDRLTDMASELNLTDRVKFLGYLSQSDLVGLYERSHALVYPSKIEGFGIPPLEALACGSSVIASDIAVLREVLGEAAFYVSLGRTTSWEKAFADLEDPEELAKRQRLVKPILKKWSWTASGERLVSAILSVDPKVQVRA